MKMKSNSYKNIFTAMSVVFFFLKCIANVSAMEDVPKVFNEEYLAASREGRQPSDKFLSHDWVKDYVADLFNRFELLGMDMSGLSESFFKEYNSVEDPFANIKSGFETWNKVDNSYKTFSKVANPHIIRSKYPLAEFLPNLERILANVVHQENQERAERGGPLPKSLEPSFLNVKSTLMRLRNDIEIASLWLNKEEGELPPGLRETEPLIIPYVGRILFVEIKGGVRQISYVGSGSVINIDGQNFILTCRHFGIIEPDADLEIYFIPHNELNPEDFLPNNRMGESRDKINWESYVDYKVTHLFLHNGPKMNSVVTFKGGATAEIKENSKMVLDLGGVQNLKKLEDAPANSDIALMQIKNPDLLGEGARFIPRADLDFDNPSIWAAGYPGGGLSGHSFALVNSSPSPLYNEIINRADPKLGNPDWHYKITNFPVVHGMSGGPVFLNDGGTILIVGVLQGLDNASCGALHAFLTEEDLVITA
ncbi:MAG: serine protease [Alphaproteobacteria bacterium]|nr:serine protease [Alphaproteobacteria bacterium]